MSQKPSFAGLAPSIIYAAVAEAILYDDIDNRIHIAGEPVEERDHNESNTINAIVAGLEIEMGNNGPEAFFRGVADELKLKEEYYKAKKAGVDLNAAFEQAQQGA